MWCMDPYQQERRRQGWGEEAGLMMGEDMGATWFWGSHETDILISFSGEELKLPSNFGFLLHPKHGKAALQRETQKLTVTNVPGIFSGDEFPDVWLGPAICCLTVTRFLFFLKKRKNKSAPASARRCGFCYSATIKYSSMERSLWFQPAGSLAVMAFMRRG